MTGESGRPRRWLRTGLLVIMIAAGVVAATTVASWRRQELGLVAGQLRPCPDSPNCVSSFEDRTTHHVDPLEVHGPSKTALSRLVELIDGMPGARIVTETDHYAHVEFVTPVMRYVDDVELMHDGASQQIHIRSASRVGHSDLGANRRRVEAIRTAWDDARGGAADE